nr:MAG TPA: hypothetical protein [Caudoviricetes sp.]
MLIGFSNHSGLSNMNIVVNYMLHTTSKND